uniref:Uncharacterized protein n=1 Tax=Anguilla anguilla TaxID=7936 RepID=A0A0E9RLC1_ANGAN
MKGPENLL